MSTQEVEVTKKRKPRATTKSKAAKPKAKKVAKSAKPKAKKVAKSAKPKAAKRSNGNGADHSVITRVTEDGVERKYELAGKTSGGNAAYDCGDEAAKMLRGKTLDETYDIVGKRLLKSELKGELAGCTTVDGIVRKLKALMKDANPGRQRMSLGNRLRGLLRAAN